MTLKKLIVLILCCVTGTLVFGQKTWQIGITPSINSANAIIKLQKADQSGLYARAGFQWRYKSSALVLLGFRIKDAYPTLWMAEYGPYLEVGKITKIFSKKQFYLGLEYRYKTIDKVHIAEFYEGERHTIYQGTKNRIMFKAAQNFKINEHLDFYLGGGLGININSKFMLYEDGSNYYFKYLGYTITKFWPTATFNIGFNFYLTKRKPFLTQQ